MNYINKDYKSKSFKSRIELSLANISVSPKDEFKLIRTSYRPFNCELCNHKYCMYQFTIENLKTKKELNVGSECIHHFQDKGVDIDLALGLLKRIQRTVLKARRDMKDDFTDEDYEKLSLEEKRTLTIKYYIRSQAKELLQDVARNKSILTKEQVNDILDLGLEDELKRAQERQKAMEQYQQAKKIESDFHSILSKAKENGFAEVPQGTADEYAKTWAAAYPSTCRNYISGLYSVYNSERTIARSQYSWLIEYKGSNRTVIDIKDGFMKYGKITPQQERYAKSLIENEQKISKMLNFVMSKKPGTFVESLGKQYNEKGFVSPKQSKVLYRIYNSIKK